MAVKRDQLIIVDVEATCWDTAPPANQINEIIEIGICLLDLRSYELLERRSILVRPEFSTVSAFCTTLTTLTQEEVERGLSFEAACALLETEYESRGRVWASWGAYDRRIFWEQCKTRKIRYPYSDRHINLKRVFADQNQKERVGMLRAMEIAGLSPEGTHHRGEDDAWNIGRLVQHLFHKHGADFLVRYW